MTKRKVRLARLTVADKTMVCPLILCIMLIYIYLLRIFFFLLWPASHPAGDYIN